SGGDATSKKVTTTPTRRSASSSSSNGFMLAVAAVLADTKKNMGAKDLHRALLKRGLAINYYTLYKNLKREAAKTETAIVSIGDKFGLREWATNDSGGSGDSRRH